MSLKCGIVGLPNVGKSTLFNCISSGKAQSANFPFCTIEPNLGSTNVPDKRLEALTELCQPKRTIPATVDIVDIAGLVKGASKGEGLEALVRDIGGAEVRLNGAEREIGALGLARADTIEKGGFSDVRKSDYTAFE